MVHMPHKPQFPGKSLVRQARKDLCAGRDERRTGAGSGGSAITDAQNVPDVLCLSPDTSRYRHTEPQTPSGHRAR